MTLQHKEMCHTNPQQCMLQVNLLQLNINHNHTLSAATRYHIFMAVVAYLFTTLAQQCFKHSCIHTYTNMFQLYNTSVYCISSSQSQLYSLISSFTWIVTSRGRDQGIALPDSIVRTVMGRRVSATDDVNKKDPLLQLHACSDHRGLYIHHAGMENG